jgi:peptidoglycan hydrolase CwlO-like protein
MKKLALTAAALAAISVGGCHKNNPDQLGENVEVNQSDNLNALSNQAANIASEAQQLQNQANQLNAEANNIQTAQGAQSAADENIQGM